MDGYDGFPAIAVATPVGQELQRQHVPDTGEHRSLQQQVLDSAKSVARVTMGGESVPPKSKSTYPQLSAHPVGQWISSIYKERIGGFYNGGQYQSTNLLA